MTLPALQPLSRGRLIAASTGSFLCPVREAGGAGHWVTIGGGDDDEGEGHGGVHVFISGAGAIEKGPRSLVGQHVAAIAHHPAAGKLKHHPVGHEPPGARDHPRYTEREAAPKPEGEPAKRPGKPYARLHGADQGTRAEQVGKALSEAQGAARGAKAAQGQDKVADTAVAHQQAQAELAAHRAAHDRNPNPWAPHLSPPVGDAKDRELAEKATRAQLAHQAAQAQQMGAQQQQQQEGQRAHEKEMVRVKAETAQAKPAFTAPAAKEKPQTAPQPEQAAARPQPASEHPAISALRNTSGYLQTKYLAPGVMRPSPESSQIIKQHHDPIIKAAEDADPSHPLHHDPEYLQARQHMNESAHKATEEYKAAQRNAPSSIPSTREPGIPAGHRLVSPHGDHAITGTGDKFHLVNRKTGEVLASHDTMSGIKRALAKAQKGATQRKARESASPTPRFSVPVASAR